MRRIIPSGHLFWSENWRRPYESHASLVAKMTWLNGLSGNQAMQIESELKHQTGPAYLLVNKQIPNEWELPINPILSLSRPTFHFCPACLLAGFHTHIPQILGLKMCPIHNGPFIKDCSNCSWPLTHLGHPHFDKTKIYICPQCKRSLTGSKQNIIKQWRDLSNLTILEAYAPFLADIQTAAARSSGYWHLHPREARLIFLYTTGLIATNLESFLNIHTVPKALSSLNAFEYTLPLTHDELALAISAIMLKDQNALQNGFESISNKNGSFESHAKPISFYHAYLNQLHYPEGCNLLDSALCIRKTLIQEAYQPAQLYPSMHVLPDGISNLDREVVHLQLRLLTAAHSLFQIIRVLDQVMRYSRKCLDFEHSDYETIRHFTRVNHLFTGTFQFLTKTEDGFIFGTDTSRLLPSFQLTMNHGKPMLCIFEHKISRLMREMINNKPQHSST